MENEMLRLILPVLKAGTAEKSVRQPERDGDRTLLLMLILLLMNEKRDFRLIAALIYIML